MAHQPGPASSSSFNAPETNSSTTRITKSNKTLRYDLTIIQQPERARACGAGAKASSDRRPVDPPPILRLQIYEVLPNGSEHDVTTQMHANYFVYAMLDKARNLAQPRNMGEVNKLAVLTGSSVAGMQPFDRPEPAIYFIFPDLSVRHEGRYRLLFSLYENIRRFEDDDKLADPTNTTSVTGLPNSNFIHRMDVRSIQFDVYSAKRFPGLTESTSLSRTFAEQGSRIRIRRDVRMRRRDTGKNKDWDDEDMPHSARLSHTPDSYSHHQQAVARPQSSSTTAQSAAGPSRRASLNDLTQPYQATNQPSAYSQPTFNTSPNQPYSQASFMHPPAQYNQPYQQQAAMPNTQSMSYYGYSQPAMSSTQQSQYPSTSFDPNAAYHQPRTFDYSTFSNDSRRMSVQSNNTQMYAPQSAHSQSQIPTFSSQPSSISMDQSHLTSSTQAPPEPMQPPTGPARVTTPNSAMPPSLNNNKTNFNTTLPPLSTSFSGSKLESSSPASSTIPTSAYSTNLTTPTDSHKRSYGSSFNTAWQNMANKQGARPSVDGSGNGIPASMFLAADGDGDDVADGADNITRFYRRAGGRTVERQIP